MRFKMLHIALAVAAYGVTAPIHAQANKPLPTIAEYLSPARQALNEHRVDTQQRIDEIERSLASMREAIRPDPRVDALVNRLSTLEDSLGGATPEGGDTSALAAEVAALKDQISAITEQAKPDPRIDFLSNRLASVEESLNREIYDADRISALSAQVTSLQDALSGVQTASSNDARVDVLVSRLADIEDSIANPSVSPNEVSALAAQVSELQGAITRLPVDAQPDPRIEVLTGRLSSLESSIADASKLSMLSAQVAAIENALNKMPGTSTTDPRIEVLSERLEALETTMADAATERIAARVTSLEMAIPRVEKAEADIAALSMAAMDAMETGPQDDGQNAMILERLSQSERLINMAASRLVEMENKLAALEASGQSSGQVDPNTMTMIQMLSEKVMEMEVAASRVQAQPSGMDPEMVDSIITARFNALDQELSSIIEQLASHYEMRFASLQAAPASRQQATFQQAARQSPQRAMASDTRGLRGATPSPSPRVAVSPIASQALPNTRRVLSNDQVTLNGSSCKVQKVVDQDGYVVSHVVCGL